MDIHLEPIGKKSHLTITSPVLGDGVLLLQCFENFLEYGLGAEVYNWRPDGESLAYSLTTAGKKKGKVRLDVHIRPIGDGIELDGRGLHMCGQSTHLHRVLVEDLHVSSFNLFGYGVDPKVAARNLGGRMYLWGNINPMLMLNGTPDQVKQAALAALEAMAPGGGFMLGDGANVCPGTPLANLAALTEASQ